MKKEQKNSPNLRFKGFTEDWELCKLIDLVVRLNKSTNSSRLPKLEFEDIVAGEGRLNKDVSQKFDNRKGIEFLPNDILYGKLRPYLKNWLKATFTGVALGDFWVFRVKNSDSDFIYSLIQADRYQKAANDTSGTKMPRSDWKKVSGTVFYVPNDLKEQQKIGTLFKQIDDAITLHQRKLDQLKELKKAYLQVMFPAKDERVPKLRFADFEGEWEQCKLGNILTERNTQQSKSKEYPLVSFTVEDGVTPKTERYEREQLVRGDKSSKKYKVTELNDIVYNPANLKFGAIARNHYGKAVFSPIYITFIVNDKLACSSYVEVFITRKDFISYSLKYQQGTVYERQSVSPENLLNMKFLLPNTKEQEFIGHFFEKLDCNSNFHKKKITQLKNLKKSYLQNMFI
ncbi:TPA: restriction endonuclease subunit S [Enterococcus faecalis]|uniref:restriction endonuclease subunit S n=2 Tax=Enterococcus faecalis TaxID=1351 RepID=UPI001780775B|nr:restriction endonuclease subunit S [Enterococcus faecalis]EGO5820380.1 restriction endonuclease subunit S [Enterococcus faecalis]EGO8390842.1 restriction endonuclease subunit S [Enterococcus faecalis]EHB6355535.1 restriction endonuclease subunit S [Enterococcus faecalis]EHQ8819692.1 restriction endonuclease subunit S [Enterococcus faecalis]EHQ8821069.1 restriction endonuclease subunit S [Enterococcus faecalis]